jgi:hypothetical protein
MSLGDTLTDHGAPPPTNGNYLGITNPASGDEMRSVQDVLSSEVGVDA